MVLSMVEYHRFLIVILFYLNKQYYLLNRRLCAISQHCSPGLQIGTAHSLHFQSVFVPRIRLGPFKGSLEGDCTSSKFPLIRRNVALEPVFSSLAILASSALVDVLYIRQYPPVVVLIC
jgi:hypothetical protein